jgi:hypothetical protein
MKKISMSYDEYQDDLSEARNRGYKNFKQVLASFLSTRGFERVDMLDG